jgi:hypothetical protein
MYLHHVGETRRFTNPSTTQGAQEVPSRASVAKDDMLADFRKYQATCNFPPGDMTP